MRSILELPFVESVATVLLAMLLLVVPQTAFANGSCDFSSPAPSDGWRSEHLPPLSLRVPADVHLRDLDSPDSSAWHLVSDGLDIRIEQAGAVPDTPAQGRMTKVGGRWASVIVREDSRDVRSLAVTWKNVGASRQIITVAATARDRKRFDLVCRILASSYVWSSVSAVDLLAVSVGPHERSAMVNLMGRDAREFRVGEFIAEDWGRIAAIELERMEIVQTMPDGSGGWQEKISLRSFGAASAASGAAKGDETRFRTRCLGQNGTLVALKAAGDKAGSTCVLDSRWNLARVFKLMEAVRRESNERVLFVRGAPTETIEVWVGTWVDPLNGNGSILEFEPDDQGWRLIRRRRFAS